MPGVLRVDGHERLADGKGGAAVREAHLDDRFDTRADRLVAEEVAVAFGQRNGLEVPLVRPRPRRPILNELAANVADPVAAFLGFHHVSVRP